jgi:hypothetical protein
MIACNLLQFFRADGIGLSRLIDGHIKHLTVPIRSSSNLWHKLTLFAVFSSRHQALVLWRVRVAININQEWWRHVVWRLLRLLIQDIIIGIPNKGTVIGVEEHLLWQLQHNCQVTLTRKMIMTLTLLYLSLDPKPKSIKNPCESVAAKL